MGTPGPQKINSYGDEFKLRAVHLRNEPGVLVSRTRECQLAVRAVLREVAVERQ